MLFMAEMEVRLPPDMPPEQADELRARERAYSQAAQRDGRWPHLRFEVYPSLAAAPGTRLHAAEITLPADACTAVYATPGYESSRGLGHPGARVEMASVTGDLRRGLVATRTVDI